ncbi:MAG: hypothetical protein NVS2B8_17530 [Vulcanimicrobiaceae bacterium]
MRSYVVKRCLQSKHSRLRRTTLSSSRESTTRVSLLRQLGQISSGRAPKDKTPLDMGSILSISHKGSRRKRRVAGKHPARVAWV